MRLRGTKATAGLGRATLSIIVGSLALLAVTAEADWLVTRDGAPMEIKGTWEIKDSLVVFTLPDGTLSSLRLTQVDVDASRALTAQKATPRPAAKPAPQAPVEAVMTITDRDVGRAGRPLASASAEEQPDDSAAATVADAKLRVASWREVVDVDSSSVEILGTLHNPGTNPATSIGLEVKLFNEEGSLIDTASAQLDQSALTGGASTQFVASFPDVLSFAAVKFDVRSRGFVSHPADRETGEGESEQP